MNSSVPPNDPKYLQMEKEARDFACELLMPENDFRVMFARAKSVEDLRYEYGVPIGAVYYRMQMLGLHWF